MKKMYVFYVIAVLILLALPCLAMAEPIDYGELIVDENTPYSMVLESINEEETESDGYIEEPSIEEEPPVDEEISEQEYLDDENTMLYRTEVLESLDYLVELQKVNVCIMISSFVVIIIAIFSLRWIY